VYAFLRRPKWIALTIGVVALMVAMVNLGFWQLRRLDQRRATNAEVRMRTAAPVTALADVLPASATFADASGVEWRNVTVTGTYDVARQVLVGNRGWVPIATKVGALPDVPAPPTGTVTITARIRRTQTRGIIGAKEAATGTVTVAKRADVARLAQQMPYPLVPAYLELTNSSQPAGDATLPRPLPLPELGEGPHLSYAVQWFVFTACAAAGWLAVVRRQVRIDNQAARRAALVTDEAGR
jgi:surfeit locus 1 family protein